MYRGLPRPIFVSPWCLSFFCCFCVPSLLGWFLSVVPSVVLSLVFLIFPLSYFSFCCPFPRLLFPPFFVAPSAADVAALAAVPKPHIQQPPPGVGRGGGSCSGVRGQARRRGPGTAPIWCPIWCPILCPILSATVMRGSAQSLRLSAQFIMGVRSA